MLGVLSLTLTLTSSRESMKMEVMSFSMPIAISTRKDMRYSQAAGRAVRGRGEELQG